MRTLLTVLLLCAPALAGGWAERLADPETREAAERELAGMGPAATAIAIPLLAHDKAAVRHAAQDVLVRIGPPAVPPLLPVLDGSRDAVVAAATVLRLIGPPARAALPRLAALVTHRDGSIRYVATNAIWAIAPQGADELFALLGTPGTVNGDRVAAALARGGLTAARRLAPVLTEKEADPQRVRNATSALERIGWLSALVLFESRAGLAGKLMLAPLEWKDSHGYGKAVRGTAPAVDVRELALRWESGSGHGGTLDLNRLSWAKGGLRCDRISFVGDKVRTETLLLPEDLARALLMLLLQATALELEADLDLRGYWSSTADFHARLRVVKGDEVLFDESYTGYPGSANIPRYFRLVVARRILDDALGTGPFRRRALDDADLAMLLTRTERIADDGRWVQERLLKIVGRIGDGRFLPMLREYIRREPDDVPRDHLYAIDAYARISGTDLRPPSFTEKELPEVRQAYLEQFEKGR